MSNMFNLSPKRYDVLREFANISAGNAATSLSQLLNKKIEMNVPDVYVAAFNEVMELFHDPETEVAAIHSDIHGDITGSMFFILSTAQAKKYIQDIIREHSFVQSSDVQALKQSVLAELGNILIGSYLSVLSNMTNLFINATVPAIKFDMFGAIISHALIELSFDSDEALIIDAVIKETGQDEDDFIKGHIFFLPDSDSYKKIFEKLEV